MDLRQKLTFRRALALPFRITPMATLLLTIHRLIGIAIAPVMVLVTAYFINTALTVVSEGQDANRIILPLVAMAACSVFGYLTNPLESLLKTHVAIKTRLMLRVPFLEKRARLEYKHAENKDTVDLLNRVWNNPDSQLSGVLDNISGLVWMTATTASYAVIFLVNAPLAGAILIALSAPIFFIAIKAGTAQYQANREATLDQRYASHIASVLTSRDTVAERNLFEYTDHLAKKFDHHYEKNRIHIFKARALWFVRSKASAIILGLLAAASLFLMAPSVANGSLSVGLFIALQGALFSTIHMIGWSLPHHFQQIAFQREFIRDVNKFLELSEIEDAEALPVEHPPEFESLEFKNVSFIYPGCMGEQSAKQTTSPGTEKVILDNLSLTIEKGKHYAFVGVNGAGKTTLTKLMTRLYDDYTGEILLNGKSLQEWPLPEIKACFCALFQDFARYDITVAENAVIGKINGATDAEIDHALDMSGFEKTAAELKDGKDTLLGKTHEAGIDLSGGQWQRLAFARAIISPAPVKILDEPTAALDPVAESQMYAQFESISRGFTTIFISHRLASAKLADTIFVLDNGRIVEQGSHEQLMAAHGLYAEMFESQQSWYV